ncbi:MAG: TetR/AcrR family transcriptional regulator [Alphaproteobacteria bacterium]|nr:TetR/AcrR family transcriptional regulator [Alphaproteobacteria bacterium]
MERHGDGRGEDEGHSRAVLPRMSERYHHGNLRAALIEAAGEIVADKGVEALSLREAARLVGVSHAAPYRHFADKEVLIAALATDGFHRLLGGIAAVPEAGAPEERLVRLAQAYVDFARNEPGRFHLMFNRQARDREKYPELYAAAIKSYELYAAAVAATLPAGADIELAADTGWALVHGIANLMLERQCDPLSTERVAALARQLIRGLAAR